GSFPCSSDEASHHSFPLDRHQRCSLAEGHADLKACGVSSLILFSLRQHIHTVTARTTEPPAITVENPHRCSRPGGVPLWVARLCAHHDLARCTRRDLAEKQPLRIGGALAGGCEPPGLAGRLIRVDATDQPL